MPPKKSKVVAAPAAVKQPKSRKSAKSSNASFPIPPSSSMAMTTALPAVMGVSTSVATFGFGGRAQELADYDPANSLRVMGRDLFDLPIKSGSGTAAAGFGGSAVYYAAVTPTDISARLANVEKIFQWYAIRRLRIMYAPATGSTSTVQVALGYITNYTIPDDIKTPTQTQVLEMQPAALFPAWQPAAIDIIHRGTKLCSTESVDAAAPYFDFIQGILACTLLNAVAGTVYGQLWLDYIVDFYQPCPVLGTVDRCLTPVGCAQAWSRMRSATLSRSGRYVRHVVDEKKDERKIGAPITQLIAGFVGESDEGILPDIDVVTPPPTSRSVRESSVPSKPAAAPLRAVR